MVILKLMKLKQQVVSADGSVKVLWSLEDGLTVESVILPRALKQRKGILTGAQSSQSPSPIDGSRFTACVSSQVGCAMACDFCLTGKQGWTRNLSAQEIVGQVLALQQIKPITNVVFMGMGEPLHNLDEVVKAIRMLKDPKMTGLSRRKILVSTSGLIDGLPELATTGVRLAISLNATTNALRDQIMPVNRRHPIDALLAAAKIYAHQVGQTVMLEYVLLRDLNDSIEDQERLFELAQGWDCKINLIPFNAFAVPGLAPGPYVRPEHERVKAFQHSLVSRGVTATVRYSGGDDVLGACGQLQSENAPVRRQFQLQNFTSNGSPFKVEPESHCK
jgi:23S rRNA (adenine2503-C2)-methyltransferase